MKNLVILFVSMLATATMAVAQTSSTAIRTESKDVVRPLYGLIGDTLLKNGTKTQIFAISDWCESLRLQTKYVRKSGNYTKAKTLIYGSMDNLSYTLLDSVKVASNSSTINGESAIITIKRPFVKIVTTAYDSTQKIQLFFKILIDKN